MSQTANDEAVELSMQAAATRLNFSIIEVMYCIGRMRFRPNNPLNTEQIAEKFGVDPAALIRFEQMKSDEARQLNPVLHALLKKEDEVNERLPAAIDAERDKRYIADDTITLANASSCGKTKSIATPLGKDINKKIAALSESYIDPSQFPEHKGKTLFNRKSK